MKQVLVGLLLAAAPAVHADDYKPVRCGERLPYEGKPLYSKPVELPPESLTLGATFSAETRARLERAVEQASARTAATAMSLAVANEQGTFESSSPKLLYWASAGKAFTATAVLELVEEGKLGLGDRLAQWFPDFPNAQVITIDDLLRHTAGIFSANEDLKVRKKPRYRTPAESIAIAARHGAMFCPGQAWRYSNTGYTLLGEIVARVERQPYAEVIRRRIIDRLELRRTRIATAGDPLTDVAPLIPADPGVAPMNPSWGEAAGSVVASAGDMLRFWHALLTGKLLSIETTRRRFDPLHPMFDSGTFYGQGVMVYDVPGALWLGHRGGTPGAKAVVAYSPADRAFVAVALNNDGSAEAVANLLLQQLRDVR